MEIKEAAIKLVECNIEKLVLSSPKSKSSVYRKMTVRPLLIQKQNMYQLERFTEKQAFQENIKPEELVDALVKSLTEEFSQLDGLYNASYINSYNYDINLEKEINLEDVFNSDIDYIKLITNKIESRINELEKELSIEQYIMVLDYLKDIILCDNPAFCICKDGIIICFSSYELDTSIPDITTFKITFEEDRSYFSNYIIDKVLGGFKGDI